MTRIKYATVGRSRKSNKIVIFRGKKQGKIGCRPTDDDGKPFGDPIYEEEVVELPEQMSPKEYDDYLERYPDETPMLREAVRGVCVKNDIEVPFEGDTDD